MASASGLRAGRAFIELALKDKTARGLRNASKRLTGFAKSVGGFGLKLAGSTAGIAAAAFGPAVKAASRMQETMAKFDVVFGGNKKAIKAWSDQFAADVGRSKEQIASFMAESQDLFVPMGFDEASATEISKTITGLAVDLASFNNGTDADALRDLKAAMTGSGEVMKKYGVILSVASVNQELMNKGIDPKKATEQQKAMARLAIIMRGTTAAQGDAVRSGDSFANMQKRLAGDIDNAQVALGTALLPTLASFMGHVSGLVGRLAEWIGANQALVLTAAKVLAVIFAVGSALAVIGGIAGAAGFAMSGMATVVSMLGTVFGVIAGAVGAVVSPVGLLVAALAAGVAWFLTSTEAGRHFAAGIVETAQAITGPLLTAWEGIVAALSSGDLEAAGDIAMAGLSAAWSEGVAQLTGVWEDFKLALIETFAGAMVVVKRQWFETQKAIADSLLEMSAQGGVLGAAASAVLGVDMQEQNHKGEKLDNERRQVVGGNLREAIAVTTAELSDARKQLQAAETGVRSANPDATSAELEVHLAADDTIKQLREQVASIDAARQQFRGELLALESEDPKSALQEAQAIARSQFDERIEALNQETADFLSTAREDAARARTQARTQADAARARLEHKTAAAVDSAHAESKPEAAPPDVTTPAGIDELMARIGGMTGAAAQATAAAMIGGTFSATLAGRGGTPADIERKKTAENTGLTHAAIVRLITVAERMAARQAPRRVT